MPANDKKYPPHLSVPESTSVIHAENNAEDDKNTGNENVPKMQVGEKPQKDKPKSNPDDNNWEAINLRMVRATGEVMEPVVDKLLKRLADKFKRDTPLKNNPNNPNNPDNPDNNDQNKNDKSVPSILPDLPGPHI